MGKEMKELRELLFNRSGGYCELCSLPLPESWALHHRKLRSRGGKHEIANVVALHHECHNLGTKAVHLNVEWATEIGFIVPSWEIAHLTPMLYYGRDKVLLTEDGQVQYII
jgi:5-methylcytosine-specific restriction endonuclease McrA